jgi:hypothetical protein
LPYVSRVNAEMPGGMKPVSWFEPRSSDSSFTSGRVLSRVPRNELDERLRYLEPEESVVASALVYSATRALKVSYAKHMH